ncbi:DUF4180 domain-containing protein [Gottfriedia acidiceleris]|uniref:DUF4180 domain-containing protein n=1 Tax=Gottfriedia acidiceleris TaxID=371036 RepID=A0ABY4JP14_9BACI|nr:DUF4180 domain-containing protein [Gottfriedia acidiceleris]UPM55588.1 DUF4180 domain-containing protein [Gottfriedia acidiceleris]
MDIKTTEVNGQVIAIVNTDSVILAGEQSALDFIMTISYDHKSNRIALNKEAISEKFFNLSTKLAGAVLQKFVNYNIKFAIIGDFSSYTSKALKDFIYECNKGNNVFFISSEQEAIDRLAKAN